MPGRVCWATADQQTQQSLLGKISICKCAGDNAQQSLLAKGSARKCTGDRDRAAVPSRVCWATELLGRRCKQSQPGQARRWGGRGGTDRHSTDGRPASGIEMLVTNHCNNNIH